MARSFLALAFLCLAPSALAQKAEIGAVTVSRPAVSVAPPGSVSVSKLNTAKPSVPGVKQGTLSVMGSKMGKSSVAAPTVGAVRLGGGAPGAGGALAGLDERQQALVEAAAKDDLGWAVQGGGDQRQTLQAQSQAENDAATKAYAAAADAGLDRSAAQTLAKAARERVDEGPKPAAAALAAPSAPATEKLPEVINGNPALDNPASPSPDGQGLDETLAVPSAPDPASVRP